MATPSLLDRHPLKDSSWKTPMPMPIWTPADKQVHRPTAICHQDSLWNDLDFFKTTFTGFSVSNLASYYLHSHEQNAAQAQCQDSCKDIQASLKSEVHALRQWVFSASLRVGRLLLNKPDILFRTGSTRNISVSVLFGPVSHRTQHNQGHHICFRAKTPSAEYSCVSTTA